MTTTLNVPCIDCGAPIHFGDTECPACFTPVDKETLEALDTRLDAASNDYRAMKTRILEAGILLLTVGLLHVAVGGFVYFSIPEPHAEAERFVMGATFGADCAVAAGMILGAWLCRKHPRHGLAVGTVAWLVPQMLLAAVAPLTFLEGGLWKAFVIVVLVRGYVAIAQAERLRAAVARSR